MLPTVTSDTTQIVLLLALLAGLLVFVEYKASSPSILEFRFAAPYNRIRFSCVALAVFTLSVIARGMTDPGSWSILLTSMGRTIGSALDFPYSPVRLALLALPSQASLEVADLLRMAAGVCYALSLVMIFVFVAIVRILGWPVRKGAFNVWLNLPLFDPTGGGDVVQRLNREASINVALGFLLPFLLPAAATLAADLMDQGATLTPQTLIWMTCVWAFLPAGMIMRGIAMHRVAELITAKRRRAYAKAESSLQTA
ncbi:hypothetical protein OO012_16645 [Rhodobacteraceae bacterium KMM 6894]|nr:hypothetical protein [Rhodobacteraceae bacterium KMM 6894]